jgi:hypothetical protein
MKKPKPITSRLLIQWLNAAELEYGERENDLAMRVVDRIKVQLLTHLGRFPEDPGYGFEYLDAAIEQLQKGR